MFSTGLTPSVARITNLWLESETVVGDIWGGNDAVVFEYKVSESSGHG